MFSSSSTEQRTVAVPWVFPVAAPQYPLDYYPPFASGCGFVLSRDLVRALLAQPLPDYRLLVRGVMCACDTCACACMTAWSVLREQLTTFPLCFKQPVSQHTKPVPSPAGAPPERPSSTKDGIRQHGAPVLSCRPSFGSKCAERTPVARICHTHPCMTTTHPTYHTRAEPSAPDPHAWPPHLPRPQDPPFGIHLCGRDACVLPDGPVVPVHEERVRPYRPLPTFRPDTLVQHYLRPEEMRPFYLQVCVACVLAGACAGVFVRCVVGEVMWCSTTCGLRR